MARTKRVAERPFASGLEHLAARVQRAGLLVAAYAARQPGWGRRDEEELAARVAADDEAVPARTQAYWREADALGAVIAAREAVTKTPLPLLALAERFSLSPLEVEVLVLCVAVRLDPRRRAVWEALSINLEQPTVGELVALLARSLPEAVALRALFSADGRLLGQSLLLAEGGDDDLLQVRLAPARTVVASLLGADAVTAELVPFSALVRPQVCLDQVVLPDEVKARVASLVGHGEALAARRAAWGIDEVVPYGRAHVLLFSGPPGTGKTMLAHAVAHAAGKPLFVVDSARLMAKGRGVEEALDGVFREAQLSDALLFFDECESLFASRALGNEVMARLLVRLERLEGVAILATNMEEMLDEALMRRVVARFAFAPPGPAARAEIWRRHLPERLPRAPDVDCEGLAAQFSLSGGYIKNAVLAAVSAVVARGAAAVTQADLVDAARLQMRVERHAGPAVESPRARLEDVVLPGAVRARVERFVEAARAQETVLGEWGLGRRLGRGTGLAALLYGPPGTGKSMTAEAIAHALGRPLLRCPVGALLSKWVGESARRIDEAFSTAAAQRAVLVFDEADALFTRRVEVRTAQDRFANAETGALLDRLERHSGVTILTTNLEAQLDPAFARRLFLTLEVPRPGPAVRAVLWARFLEGAPLGPDVDPARLAQFDLSGAEIRTAVLTACLEAAGAPPGARVVSGAALARAAGEQGAAGVSLALV